MYSNLPPLSAQCIESEIAEKNLFIYGRSICLVHHITGDVSKAYMYCMYICLCGEGGRNAAEIAQEQKVSHSRVKTLQMSEKNKNRFRRERIQIVSLV